MIASATLPHPSIFFSTEQFVAEAKTANYGTLRAVIVLTLKSTLACYFQYFQEAIDFCEEAEHVGKQVVNISFARLSWLFALTYAHLRIYLAYGRRKNLGKFRKYKKLLAKLSSDGSPDAETLLVFISALEMTIKRKIDKQQLIDGFENAISHLSEKGNLCLEGLLVEQAGFDLAKRGHRTESRIYIDRALDIYQFKWCSVAKHEWLTERSARSYAQTEGSLSPSQIGSVIICDKTV